MPVTTDSSRKTKILTVNAGTSLVSQEQDKLVLGDIDVGCRFSFCQPVGVLVTKEVQTLVTTLGDKVSKTVVV